MQVKLPTMKVSQEEVPAETPEILADTSKEPIKEINEKGPCPFCPNCPNACKFECKCKSEIQKCFSKFVIFVEVLMLMGITIFISNSKYQWSDDFPDYTLKELHVVDIKHMFFMLFLLVGTFAFFPKYNENPSTCKNLEKIVGRSYMVIKLLAELVSDLRLG